MRRFATIFIILLLPLLAAQQLYIPPFTLPATTCSNQFVRSIAAATGVGTCASIAAGDFPTLTGDVTTPGGSLATTIAANAVTNAKAAQMANSTIKCRTTSGTGNSEDCTAAQAAAIIGGVGGALKSNTISGTRDLTTATGTQALTGMGFQPTSCLGVGQVASSLTQYITLFGMSDSSRNVTSTYLAGSVLLAQSGNFLVFGDVTATNFNNATISSYDSDGLTLSWTKSNSPTGTASFRITCYR